MTEQLDHPFYEVVNTAERLIANGAKTLQKFTCVGCGARQTMPEFNRFYTKGTCEECGALTDIEAKGCNYVLIMPVPQ